MYDAVIVGARCAGSTLATLLARKGARVLLVDRATFPSDIPHGHFIHRGGPQRLQRWGLLDRVAAQAPAITTAVTDFGDFPLVSRNMEAEGVAWAYAPRRLTLDASLLDAAVDAGVEVRQGFSVDEFLFDNETVVGVHGRADGGGAIEERGTIIVGADGRNSRLARAVGAPSYNEVPVLLCWYFSYWTGVQAEPFEMYTRSADKRVILAFRTNDDLYAIFMAAPIEELASFRADIEANFLKTIDLVPEFAGRVAAGKRVERFYGASDLPNFYRKPFGPGWALVGDAGLHKDPHMALGICDALRDVEFLSEAIGQGLQGDSPMHEALKRYEERRNQASNQDYQDNISAARFTPIPSQVLGLRAALRDNPQGATDFLKARFGLMDPGEFFNPENLQRIMAGASN